MRLIDKLDIVLSGHDIDPISEFCLYWGKAGITISEKFLREEIDWDFGDPQDFTPSEMRIIRHMVDQLQQAGMAKAGRPTVGRDVIKNILSRTVPKLRKDPESFNKIVDHIWDVLGTYGDMVQEPEEKPYTQDDEDELHRQLSQFDDEEEEFEDDEEYENELAYR